MKRLFILTLLLSLIFAVSFASAQLSLTYPGNTTSSEKVTYFNWTHSIVNVSSCWYTLDSGATNVTMGCSDPTISTFIDSSEDTNVWTIYSNDTSGTEYSNSTTFWVDSISPNITLPYLNNPIHYKSTPYFTLTILLVENNPYFYLPTKSMKFYVWDIIGGLHYNEPSMNSSNISEINYNSADFDDEGNYTYNITTGDTMGHNTSISGKIIMDFTTPLVSISSPLNQTYSYQINNITFTASDSYLSYCQFSNSTSIVNISCLTTYSTQGIEGSNTWNITAYDLAGNSNFSSVTFFVDSIAPAIDFENETTQSGAYSQDFITANVTASDVSLDTITISLYNSTSFVNSSSSATPPLFINFSGLADGTYYLNATANDSVAHVNATGTRTIILDSTVPLISFSSPTPADGENSSSSILTVNVSVIEQNLANITFRLYNTTDLINETIFSTNTYTISYTLTDGSYQYNVTITDQVANSNSTSTRSVNIDSTQPTVTLVGPADNSPFGPGSTVLFEYNVSDNSQVDNCSLVINSVVNQTSTPNQSITNNFTFSPSSGEYIWSISCLDAFNNTGFSSQRNFTLLSIITTPTNSNYTNLSAESDIGNVSYFYFANEYGIINFSQPIDFSDGIDWGPFINLSFNKAFANSTGFPGFNTSAEIRLYNITFTTPRILKDSSVCSDCVQNYYTNGTISFNVTGFSTYETEETPTGGGSSGGGGGGSSSGCTTTWTCTNWGECVGGQQTRNCTKVDQSCSKALTLKPSESQTCSIGSEDQDEDDQGTSEEEEEEIIEEEPGFFVGITGAAIGTTGGRIATGAILILLIVGAYAFVKLRKDEQLRGKVKGMLKKTD